MKNFNVKQSGSEVILEEVNPYLPMLKHSGKAFAPLILTSIDPQIKVGQVIREDQLEPDLWQFFTDGSWYELKYRGDYYANGVEKYGGYKVRQVAKLKQPFHEMTGKITVSEINGLPAINGLYCSYASKEIRAEIESRFEAEKSFTLPEKYTYIITPLNHAKISRSRITEGNNQPVHETPKSGHDLETCTEKEEKVTGETPIQEAPDYEKLLVENRKSFREALRRQRKANAILHAEIERLKVLVPVQEHKPESEENLNTLELGIEIVAAMKASLWDWDIESGRMDALSDTEIDRLSDLDMPFEEYSPEDQEMLTNVAIKEKERLHKQAEFAAKCTLDWFKKQGFEIKKKKDHAQH